MSELKINLGCGGNILPGFLNHDADVDITKRLPWGDNTVDFILLEHVWEHISGPDALRCLDECYRILKPGGVLRLLVPVLDRLTRKQSRSIILEHGHLCAYTPRLIAQYLWSAGFELDNIKETERLDVDGHWKTIGEALDTVETARLEAKK